MSSSSPPLNFEQLNLSSSELELKDQGNAAFKLKKYDEAEGFYRQAISAASSSPSSSSTCHVLFSNLAAVFFEQGRLEECVEAADHSLALQSSWLKGYCRKAMALEALPSAGPGAVLAVWEAAARHCEPCALLKKQHGAARVRWQGQFKRAVVTSSQDLLARYSLLTDPREKLSTMAHFWNASSKIERFQHFNCFLHMIAGAGGTPQLAEDLSADSMQEMPLHNYHDLPRAALEPWCAFFEQAVPEEKTRLFREIWALLSPPEQTAVIADLRLLVGGQQWGGGQQHDEVEEVGLS